VYHKKMNLFELGRVDVSDSAATAIHNSTTSLSELLARHQTGDWQEESDAAQQHNEFAAQNGLLVASEYVLSDGQKILIVTAQDRSNTRIMQFDEYRYVEVGVREGYARWAGRYDGWKNPLIVVEEPAVIQLLQGLDFKTVLEVGVGTGRHAFRLAQDGAQVVGLDLSPEMLKVAQAKSVTNETPLTLVQGSIEEPLPFSAECFDLVLSALALSHVADLQAPFMEFARVQHKGGVCLMSVYHPDAIASRWRTSLMEAEGVYRLPNSPHTRQDYLTGLQAAGYRIRQTLDLRVADVPDGYFTPEMVVRNGEKGLCLIILAERQG
jgi:SAM-dependent methyltransferase/post-segregation antitoxin (ccd killing protein)